MSLKNDKSPKMQVKCDAFFYSCTPLGDCGSVCYYSFNTIVGYISDRIRRRLDYCSIEEIKKFQNIL